MSEIEFYKPLVANGPRRIDAPTEADYLSAWQQHAQPLQSDLLACAVTGGLIADRPAWAFMAGYQAACRHAFPGAEISDWVAYAATEDRKPESPLPGVTRSGAGASATLTGSKTWVAGARSISQLIVKVGSGATAAYYCLNRDSQGLELDPRAPASFLSELSQGHAHLNAVAAPDASRLDTSNVPHFRYLEPLYIYAAFCGLVMGATTDSDLVICCHDCLDGVEPALASIDRGELDVHNLQKADARAQDLLVRLSGNRIDARGDWDNDQRLFLMYSKGIRRL